MSHRVLRVLALVLVLAAIASAQYITTCHNDNECGTVCGRKTNDIASPTEGIFGTSCSCQGGAGLTKRCDYAGHAVEVCSNYQPPNCKTSCNQQICIHKDGRKATATVLSACPAHHPQNTGDCCTYKNDDYCTCIIRQTLDINWKPYGELGGRNGWASGASWGACNGQLARLNISIASERATKLVQPFVIDNTHETCTSQMDATWTGYGIGCELLDAATCSITAGCTYCSAVAHSGASEAPVATQCYSKGEAAVLTHILNTEAEATVFTCSIPVGPHLFHLPPTNCTKSN